MSAPSAPLPSTAMHGIPEHIAQLLERLHGESLAQEKVLAESNHNNAPGVSHAELMKDKFIALEQDKAEYVYQLCRAINAKTIVEAGTSYGVSTIYLALAATANANATGGKATVIATEHEPEKARQAREHWAQCGESIVGAIDLREGDLRETLKENLENVDFLLLDIWTPMALPTLKVVQPKLRHGAVIITDNTIGSAEGYKDLLGYIRDPQNGFTTMTLPFYKGLEMSVYLPQA